MLLSGVCEPVDNVTNFGYGIKTESVQRMFSEMELLWLCLCVFMAGAAGMNWVEHTGSCYWLKNSDTTMTEAEVTCSGIQATVVELESPGEFLVVNQLLNGAGVEAWVALTKHISGSWRWTNNGSEAETSMWKTGEPNDTGGCVRLVRYFVSGDLGNHFLADHPCTMRYRPFCEKPSSPTTSKSKRLSTLPANLCPVLEFVTSSRLECAQSCALSTSCYVYSFENSNGASRCSFHRLLETCAHWTSAVPGLAYYKISRSCS